KRTAEQANMARGPAVKMMTGTHQSLGDELVVVGLLQKQPNVFGRAGLLQKAAKRIVAKLPRDVLQGSQVVARPIRRRHEQEEKLHFVAVETIEIDSLDADTDRPYQSLDAGVLGMGNGHAAANACAAQFFAFHNRSYDSGHVGGRDGPGGSQRLDQL